MNTKKPLTFWEVFTSTLAAVIGVQNDQNRERDFSRGNVVHFILSGFIFTILFIVSIVVVVNIVLSGQA